MNVKKISNVMVKRGKNLLAKMIRMEHDNAISKIPSSLYLSCVFKNRQSNRNVLVLSSL